MPPPSLLAALLSISAVQAIIVPQALFPVVGPYVTEPKHIPILWKLKNITDDPSLLSEGYFMFSPRDLNGGWGPHIYGTLGDLIWDSSLSHPGVNTNEFRVCDFKGASKVHLCFHDKPGYAPFDTLARPMTRLGDRVFDETYAEVGVDWTDAGDIEWRPDNHEFNMLPGGESFTRVFNQHFTTDMTPYGGPLNGTFISNAFVDVDVYTGTPIFTWRTGDHLQPWWTYIFPSVPGRVNQTSGIAGTGANSSAWDLFHMNAIDKNEEGDYFVSIRHMNAILKIAGVNNQQGIEPGRIIWTLGGKVSNFSMDFIFSRQHHVRHVSTSSTETVITLFNNAWEGWSKNEPSSPQSSGMIISINNETMTATLLHEYKHPYGALSGSRGSTDLQPNGNVIVSWGLPVPHFSEFSPAGELLFHAELDYPQFEHTIFSYRGHKMPWVGKPTWKPSVKAYTHNCLEQQPSPLIAYASWNGATEVAAWRFWVAKSTVGPWDVVGVFARTGFETKATLETGINGSSYFMPYVYAEALDRDGGTLGGQFSETYVPGQEVAPQCDFHRCIIPNFPYDSQTSVASECTIRSVGEYVPSHALEHLDDIKVWPTPTPGAASPSDQTLENFGHPKQPWIIGSGVHALASRPWWLLAILLTFLTFTTLAALGLASRVFYRRRASARLAAYRTMHGIEKTYDDRLEEVSEFADSDSRRNSYDEDHESNPLTAYRDSER